MIYVATHSLRLLIMTPSFEQALHIVQEKLTRSQFEPAIESVPLERAWGRILAEDAKADRDYPPFHRSARDGFAVRSQDLIAAPTCLQCVGEVRAGGHFEGTVGPGQCASIMTGAPLPDGADAVIMVEHTSAEGSRVKIQQSARNFDNVVRRGSEAAAGAVALPRGRRLGAAEAGLLASLGVTTVKVFRQPSVAILTTGDELVDVGQTPQWFQIRNSNSVLLAAQTTEAGGVPRVIGIAPDEPQPLKLLIQQGLESDLLVCNGGVSAGRYDLVEQVLEEIGAEFYFQSVAIRPGKPAVFGQAGGTFFFGLPGNPVSAYVTFEVFVRPAIRILAGARFEEPVFLCARLAKPLAGKAGLTTFVPARVEGSQGAPVVEPVSWQGSGDLVGAAAGNCFLVLHPEQNSLSAGDWVGVMPKRY